MLVGVVVTRVNLHRKALGGKEQLSQQWALIRVPWIEGPAEDFRVRLDQVAEHLTRFSLVLFKSEPNFADTLYYGMVGIERLKILPTPYFFLKQRNEFNGLMEIWV